MTKRRFNLFSNLIIWIFLFEIISNCYATCDPNTCDDSTLIAQTMREIQARYHDIYHPNSYIGWDSSCLCGNIKVPFYPPDDFFKPCLENDPGKIKTIELINSIKSHFWELSIYTTFVDDDYWKLEGVETLDITYKTSRNDPDIARIYNIGVINNNPSSENFYRTVLKNIYEVVTKKLKKIEVPEVTKGSNPEQLIYPFECWDKMYGVDQQYLCLDSCSTAKAKAKDSFVWDEVWENRGGWEHVYFAAGVQIQNNCHNEGCECPGCQGYVYQLYKWATRCKLCCDLSNFNGTAECFLQLRLSEYDDWDMEYSGGLKATEAWQHFEDVSTGDFWVSQWLGNFKPDDGTEAGCEEVSTVGWDLWAATILVTPDFNTEPNDFEDEGTPAPVIYKSESIVYAANTKCDGENSSGETVDGKVDGCSAFKSSTTKCITVRLLEEYEPNAATLMVNGTGLHDPNHVLCVPNVNSIPFSVKGGSMAPDANEIPIRFKVSFWRTTNNVTYYGEQEVELTVKPNSGNICCRDTGVCQFVTNISVGKTGIKGVFCVNDSKDAEAKVTEMANGDIEVKLPDRDEKYIMKHSHSNEVCDFIQGWYVTKTASNVIKVIYPSGGYEWEFQSNSPYKLTSKNDLEGIPLVYYEYDQQQRLKKQVDANDENKYIIYDYNDAGPCNYLPSTITAQAEDVNRVFVMNYDENCRLVSISGDTGCSSCSSRVGNKYELDENDNIKKELTLDDQVIYEYVRDLQGRILEKWLGPKTDGNCVQRVRYVLNPDKSSEITTLNYIDANEFTVSRQCLNPAGLTIQNIKFNAIYDDPNIGFDPNVVENIQYIYTGNVLTKMVTYPATSDFNEPQPDSGARKEYTYDTISGNMIQEKWFAADDSNFIVGSYVYENVTSGGQVYDTRILNQTDARGVVTSNSYDANNAVEYKTMPQVTTGISGNLQNLQLKYHYQYDSCNRVELEQQIDASNNTEKILVQTKYEYDKSGNLKKRYDDYQGTNQQITEYRYNGFNEMTRTISPSGQVQGWDYYDNGKTKTEYVLADANDINEPLPNLISQTKYTYDPNGRLTLIAKAKDDLVNGAFDFNEPQQWVYTAYKYDIKGNKTQVIEDVNGLNLTTVYEYNNQNQLEKVTLPNGKWTKTFRNGRGLVERTVVGYDQTDVAATEYFYDDRGNQQIQIAPNGVKTVSEYDDFGRLKKLTQGL